MINNIINEIINYIDNKNHFYNNLSNSAYYDVLYITSLTREEADNKNTQFVRLKDYTIQKMIEVGVKDLPMLERVGHVRENVLTVKEAKRLGYSVRNKHYHGLGVKTYLEIINAIDNSDAIVYEYTDEPGHYIIESPIEINGIKPVVPVSIDQKGRYNDMYINYNKIRTVFTPSINYINNLLNKGTIKEVVAGDNYQKALLADNNRSKNSPAVNFNNINISYTNNDVKHVFDELLLLLTVI